MDTPSDSAPHPPDEPVTVALAQSLLQDCLGPTTEFINDFTYNTFRCIGGRMGSGMGTLLEGVWAFYARAALHTLRPDTIDIAWEVDNGYNDFSVVDASKKWTAASRQGELFGIEAKSMNMGAVEIKGHFDPLVSEIGPDDLLLALGWRWAEGPDARFVYPRISYHFLGSALEVAHLRDALHLARGSSFVDPKNCPDGCDPTECVHAGEPLNKQGNRERKSGPTTTRGSGATANSQNFGGLKRMLGTKGERAKEVLEEQCRDHPVRKQFVDFMEILKRDKRDTDALNPTSSQLPDTPHPED